MTTKGRPHFLANPTGEAILSRCADIDGTREPIDDKAHFWAPRDIVKCRPQSRL